MAGEKPGEDDDGAKGVGDGCGAPDVEFEGRVRGGFPEEDGKNDEEGASQLREDLGVWLGEADCVEEVAVGGEEEEDTHQRVDDGIGAKHGLRRDGTHRRIVA